MSDFGPVRDEDVELADCCVCGRPAVEDYQGREDCPSCGRVECEWRMQQFLDFQDEVGNRG